MKKSLVLILLLLLLFSSLSILMISAAPVTLTCNTNEINIKEKNKCTATGCERGWWIITNLQNRPLNTEVQEPINDVNSNIEFGPAGEEGEILTKLQCLSPNFETTHKTNVMKAPYIDCPDSCPVREKCICNVNECSEGLFLLKNRDKNPLSNNVIEEINDVSFSYTFKATRQGKVEVKMVCDNPFMDKIHIIEIFVPDDMKFYMSSVSCDQTNCKVTVVKNTQGGTVNILVQLFEEPYGVIYYTGSADVSAGFTGEKEIALTKLKDCTEGADLKVLAIASSSGQRIDRLKEDYIWGVSGGIKCGDGSCDSAAGEDEWNCCEDCGVPFSGCDSNARYWYTCDNKVLKKNTYDCNRDDRCTAYENGCEDRDYYCEAGECKFSSSNKNTDGCSLNNFLDYNCSTEGCAYKSYDCSANKDWDKDSVLCNCDCNGYDIKESLNSGNCRDGKDNDCDGFLDDNDCDCMPVCDRTYECSSFSCDGKKYNCFFSNAGEYIWGLKYPDTETACDDAHDNNCDDTCDANGCDAMSGDADCGICNPGQERNGGDPNYCQKCDSTGHWGNGNEGSVCDDYADTSTPARSPFCSDETASSSKVCDLACESGSCSDKINCVCQKDRCGAQCSGTSGCTETSKCDGKIYKTRTASCSDTCTCSYGEWVTGTCAHSVSNCGAACDGPEDCGGRNCQADCTCSSGKPNGQTCTLPTECSSNNCKDGVCCNSACNGRCQRCNLAGSVGTCKYIPSGQDPDNECPYGSYPCVDNYCNGVGDCQYSSSSKVCLTAYDYDCRDGTGCEKDVYRETVNRYCSGSDYTCTGTIQEMGDHVLVDDCNSTERCTENFQKCVYDSSCGKSGKGGSCTSTQDCVTGLNCVDDRAGGKVCCDPSQCANAKTCYNSGTLSDSFICDNTVWKECTSSLKCSELTIGTNKYYCDPATVKWKSGDSKDVDCGLCKKCSDTGTCSVNYDGCSEDTTDPEKCLKTNNECCVAGNCVPSTPPCKTKGQDCTSTACCSGLNCVDDVSGGKTCCDPAQCADSGTCYSDGYHSGSSLCIATKWYQCAGNCDKKYDVITKTNYYCHSDNTWSTSSNLNEDCGQDKKCDGSGNCVPSTPDSCTNKADDTDCGVCKSCSSGVCSGTPVDDADCGTIDCDGLDTTCRNYNDLTSNRCKSFGTCKSPNTADCTSYTNAPSTTNCGTKDCTSSYDDYCSGNSLCKYTGSCIKYCSGSGSCNDCPCTASCNSCGTTSCSSYSDYCSGLENLDFYDYPVSVTNPCLTKAGDDVCDTGTCSATKTTCSGSGCCDATCSATSGCGLSPNDAKCNSGYTCKDCTCESSTIVCCFETSSRSCLTQSECTARGGLYSTLKCNVAADCPCLADGKSCSIGGVCCSGSCIGGICMSSTSCPGTCVGVSTNNILCISYCGSKIPPLQMKGCPTHTACPKDTCCCVCGEPFSGTTGLSNIPNAIRQFFSSIIDIFTKAFKP